MNPRLEYVNTRMCGKQLHSIPPIDPPAPRPQSLFALKQVNQVPDCPSLVGDLCGYCRRRLERLMDPAGIIVKVVLVR